MCGCCLPIGMLAFPWSALATAPLSSPNEAFAYHQASNGMTASRGSTCKTWLGLPGVVGDWLGCSWWASSTTPPCGPSWGVMVSVTHRCPTTVHVRIGLAYRIHPIRAQSVFTILIDLFFPDIFVNHGLGRDPTWEVWNDPSKIRIDSYSISEFRGTSTLSAGY